MLDLPFVSAASANALISDLRPTTLSPLALSHVNSLLDELLVALVSAAHSINPAHLRLQGIPSVFAADRDGDSTGLRALGRSAIGEAEVEIRSWYEGHPGSRSGGPGFPPSGKGRGLVADKERAGGEFPLAAAIDLIRLKAATFSTLASQEPLDDNVGRQITAKWKDAGGDQADETVSPAGLWVTAILEYICEHILSQLSRVVARDSSISVAGPQDLYTALCEDDSVYGFFKRMKAKTTLESTIRASERAKRGPSQQRSVHQDIGAPSPTASPYGSRVSLTSPLRELGDMSSLRNLSSPPSAFDGRVSSDTFRKGAVVKPPSAAPVSGHERSSSVLSVSTRQMIGAFNDDAESRPSLDRSEDDFDALIRSGETVKVSLTPSRLKTFENVSVPRATQPKVQARGATRTDAGDDLATFLATTGPSTTEYLPSSPNRGPQGSRSRSSSTKLVPRGPTIEENIEEEEDSARGPSLIELLKSEPPATDIPQTPQRRGSTPARTVPAVVLGTPPPTGPSTTTSSPAVPSRAIRRPSQPSVNRPGRRPSDESMDDDEHLGNRHPARSEARELADFLNSMPPPHLHSAREEQRISRKEPRFKTFISRVTGSGGKKDKTDDKSLGKAPQNFESSLVSSPSIQFLTRGHDQLQLKSHHSQASSPTASITAPLSPSPSLSPQHTSAEPSRSILRKPLIIQESAVALTVATAMEVAFSQSESRSTAIKVSHVDVLDGAAVEDEHIGLRPEEIEATALAPPILTPSDANSFRTAQDGDIDGFSETDPRVNLPSEEREVSSIAAELGLEPAADITSVSPPDRSCLDDYTLNKNDHRTSDETTPTAVSYSTPMIPLVDLVPVRHLLDHATSARECRLLLDAILTQFGVPPSNRLHQTPLPTPEDRVTAWLLAGREGPVGDVASNATTGRTDEVLITPTLHAVEALPESPVMTGHEDEVKQETEEELISEMTTNTEIERETDVAVVSTGDVVRIMRSGAVPLSTGPELSSQAVQAM